MRLLALLVAAAATTAAIPFPPGLECAELLIELTHREICSRPSMAGDTIKIHYRGTFTNGTEFDSSIGQEPLKFALGQKKVIKGFDEGAMNMCVGDKRKVIIPPLLGYGNKQRGPISPNSTLIFETELVEIVGVPKEKA
ncbi:Peptidyl-prolyl cis-trans isomerase fpr2 [Ophidiomyces ophidiicola]|nr:Peptidyl-prolyl cis-trans isomerase fpr2 [Ophidiomyces ophidiicola]